MVTPQKRAKTMMKKGLSRLEMKLFGVIRATIWPSVTESSTMRIMRNWYPARSAPGWRPGMREKEANGAQERIRRLSTDHGKTKANCRYALAAMFFC